MNKDDKKQIKRKILEGASADVIRRYGSAVKEHVSSYVGKDQGKELTRGLKEISESKVNKDNKYQNIKQQAGFSAETKSVAKSNAEKAINDDNTRIIRTDDMTESYDKSRGVSVGKVNDELFDLAELDSEGIYIDGSATQVKFVGGDAKSCASKLLSSKFDKYRNNDVEIEIPKDFYDDVIKDYNERIEELKKQVESAESRGDKALAAKHQESIQEIEKTRDNLKQSNVTNDEAIFARLHPELSVVKDIVSVAHHAGMEQAKTGAIISGSISMIKNIVACANGEKDVKSASIDFAKDTGKGAAYSYATAFSGSVVKGIMQNSGSEYVRTLSGTQFPSTLVSTTINVGKTMSKYIHGEIDGADCIELLGKNGVAQIGSAFYSTIAVAAVAGAGSTALTVVAGIAGSTFGYSAAVAVYDELATSLKEYNLSVENRKVIEAECEEAIALILQYRAEMSRAVEQYMTEYLDMFSNAFTEMDNAILNNDSNGFIKGNAQIQRLLGHEVQFNSQDEFDSLMMSDDSFKL